jgi:photosystem II stability/assembly factor-like uncharacterized protein
VVVNLHGGICHTDDGGQSWELQFDGSEQEEGVRFRRARERMPRVARTVDGGLTWREIVIPGTTALQGVGFLSESTGWTSGRGTTSHTTDGGLTWTSVDVLDGSVNRFHVLNDTLAYAFGHRIHQWSPIRTEGGRQPEVLAPRSTRRAASRRRAFLPGYVDAPV